MVLDKRLNFLDGVLMAYPAELYLPDFIRGDTFQDIVVNNLMVKGAPAVLQEVRVQLRTKSGVLLHTFDAEISDANNVLIRGINYLDTEKFPVGEVDLELEATTESVGRITLLRGSFRIIGDVTR